MKILVINGPNLNMLGTREPEKYGTITLEDIQIMLKDVGNLRGASIEFFQSNHEGELIDKIQSSNGVFDGIVLNAGGYTHTSVALRDAILSVDVPVVEVHMTNIHSREEFRHTSLISGVCLAQVVGFKHFSYKYALEGLIEYLS